MQEVLEKIRSDKNKTLSLALWYLLIKVPSSFDVISCSYLKETAWIPDEHEEFYRPSECFDPTDENRNILGNSVVYLHPDFDISEDNKGARSLAERLGINLDANTDSVLNYLQILSGSKVDIEDIKPLYLFLYQQNASLRDVFKEEHLTTLLIKKRAGGDQIKYFGKMKARSSVTLVVISKSITQKI